MPQEASRRVGMKRKTGFWNNVVFRCFGFGQMRVERKGVWNGHFGQQFLQLTKHQHHQEKRKREKNVICFGASNTFAQLCCHRMTGGIEMKRMMPMLLSLLLGYTNIYEFDGINTWPYEIGS